MAETLQVTHLGWSPPLRPRLRLHNWPDFAPLVAPRAPEKVACHNQSQRRILLSLWNTRGNWILWWSQLRLWILGAYQGVQRSRILVSGGRQCSVCCLLSWIRHIRHYFWRSRDMAIASGLRRKLLREYFRSDSSLFPAHVAYLFRGQPVHSKYTIQMGRSYNFRES